MKRQQDSALVARCSDECGEHQIPTDAMQVTVCTNAPNLSAYVFRCPKCAALIHRPATPSTVTWLREVGATMVLWSLPAQEAHSGPPLTEDDLIDFGLGLRGDFSDEMAA